jgi:hypothetical protein
MLRWILNTAAEFGSGGTVGDPDSRARGVCNISLLEFATYKDKLYKPATPERTRARAPRWYSREALLGSKRRTQGAVVASVILEPCRAYLPHDNGQ